MLEVIQVTWTCAEAGKVVLIEWAYEQLFLGHTIHKSGVRSKPQKPWPADKKAVQQIPWPVCLLQAFCQIFHTLPSHWPHLTKSDIDFKGETQQVKAFQELKWRLQTPLVLAHFDEDADTETHTLAPWCHASSKEGQSWQYCSLC